MRRAIWLTGVVAGAAFAAGLAGSASAVEGIGVPAQVVDVSKETLAQEHPTIDYGATGSTLDDRQGTTTWRVVKDTGNCCENHVTTSSDGRLFDIGGSYINYTDDRGLTWKSVRPINPLVNGEGSMAVAPNGDVVGMTWDAYTGDHFVAYKYNAVSKKWFTLDTKLHQPFYDRPWLSVVPGPFAIGLGADTVPYITLVSGGPPGAKDPMWLSTDGLSYHEASSILLDGLTDTPVTRPFPITADASFDWIQPIRSATVTGLGGGYALANGGWLLNPEDRKWDQWRLPGNVVPPTFVQIDSRGRIHNVRSAGASALEYRISRNGGLTWTSAVFPFQFGGLLDFKVNAAVGVGALAQRLNHQDLVYKFDVTGDTAKLMRRYRVGLGDNPAGSSIGALTNPRMDFQTVAIFPDGRVAVSFLDSTTFSHPPGTGMLGRITPALAIELGTTLPPLKPDLVANTPTVSPSHVTSSDEVTFSAVVDNTAFGDATDVAVRFLVDGEPVGSDVTVDELAAGASTTVTSPAWSASGEVGTHTVEVVVDPTGAIVETSEGNNSAGSSFTVHKTVTTLAYTGDTVVGNGGAATLAGVLTFAGGSPLAGRSVTFSLGGSQSCSATTDAGGRASCTVKPVSQPNGQGFVSAAFAGDSDYEPSAAGASTLVYDFAPGGGAFVIGDRNSGVGTSVTFWGAQWAKLNSLSGSASPSTFKGFAHTPARAACGTTWTGQTGADSPPAAPLAAYIGVVAASSAGTSSSLVKGTTAHVVVVRTNPGYQPDPAFAGTGTVVATVC